MRASVRASARRGSSDCEGRLRRATARYVRADLESHPAGDLEPDVAARPASGAAAAAAAAAAARFTGDPARSGLQFLPISAGEGEGGWFPAPQPLIVGFGAPALAAAVLRIFGVRTKC